MKSAKRISVLLADDHMRIREGLKTLLKAESDIEVVGEASTGRQAVELTRKLRPDVIVMDISMPQTNGLEATRQIRKDFPDTKVIILSTHSDDAYVESAADLGASAYLLKHSSAHFVAEAIREVHNGETFFSPAISKRFRSRPQQSSEQKDLPKAKAPRLSSREGDVLRLIAEGEAIKQIAESLSLSIKTVEKHRDHLMQKLAIHDIAGLTRYAIAAGIIESGVQLTII
jgi:DNA-binding NarL/FixJ family response regulator